MLRHPQVKTYKYLQGLMRGRGNVTGERNRLYAVILLSLMTLPAIHNISAIPGDPPVAIIDSPADGSTWYADEGGVNLSANSSYDPDGGNLTFTWYAREVGGTLNTTILTGRYGWVALEPGEYIITLNVTDEENLTGEASVRITVEEHRNRPPIPHIASPPENSTYPKSSTVLLSAEGTEDEDPDALIYSWYSSLSGYLGGGIQIEVVLPEGRHQITLFADDGEYNVSASVNVTVYNRAPAAGIVGPVRVNLGEEAHFRAEAEDPDGDPLTFSWDMGDGTLLTGLWANHTYMAGGHYTVTLRVDDGSLSNSTAEVNQTIFVNTPPEVEQIDDQEAVVGEPLNLTARAEDPDGEPLTFLWDMDGDGTWDASGQNISYIYSSPGEYTALLNVSDPTAWTPLTFRVTVLEPNSPPVAGAVSPVVVTLEGASVTAELDASPSYDPDDDLNGDGRIEPPEVDNLTYIWDTNPHSDTDGDGIPDNDADLEGKFVRVVFTEPGEHKVLLKVIDPRGAWDTFEVTVIVNRPPSAEVEGPERAISGQTLNFTAEGSYDPDGDTLTYLWDFGDGNKAQGKEVSHTYTATGVFTVTLTVSDGYAEDTAYLDVEVYPLPQIVITSPGPYSEVAGEVYITGRVDVPRDFTVERVEISVDGSAFVEASPTRGSFRSFTYRWDTTEVEDGRHTIRIRALVEGIWVEHEITLNVNNGGEEEGGLPAVYIILTVAILIMLVVVAVLLRRSRSALPTSPPETPHPTAPPPTFTPFTPATTPAPQKKPQTITLRVHCPRCGKYFDHEGEATYPIRLRCPHCGARGVIEREGEEMEEKAGVPVVCPACEDVFYLKEQKPFMTCPHCGARGKVPHDVLEELERLREERSRVMTLKCPRCGEKFEMPRGHKGATVCPHCGAMGYI